MLPKFQHQNNQYSFPYHHVPFFGGDSAPVLYRDLEWGFEYLSYVNRVVELTLESTKERVLEVGCGDGRIIGEIGLNVKEAVGVDLSEPAIRFAKAFYPETSFLCEDVSKIDEQYDVVIAVEVLEHIEDENVQDFCMTLFQCIAPGGTLIISVPTIVRPVHKKHYRHYTFETLMENFSLAQNNLLAESVEYLCAEEKGWYKGLKRLMVNKYWKIYSEYFNKFSWNYYQKKLQKATSSTGTHLIVKFKKISD